MSYWNDAEIIFEENYGDNSFRVSWSKFKKEDEGKCLGIGWSNFPKQKRKRKTPQWMPLW